jgi:poly-beta-1,6-N-acetyl-D-glucosamine N-deacetylase
MLLLRRLALLALLPLTIWADAHIFVYHRFGDPKHASTNTSVETLRQEFEYFKQNGYTVIPLSALADAYKQNKPIDPKWVVLTIDDAYKSFYENGLPLFREYGYPFTLFVYVEATEQHYGDYMSWEQLKETRKYGELGLHSYGHPHLVSLSDEAVHEDTRKAFDSYKTHLGEAPRYYAYPYGEYDADVRKEIASFGFDLIINQNSGAIDGQSDPHDLDRTALTGENTVAQKLKIKTLPTRWHTPASWPADGKLKTIHATIPDTIKSLEYYVSGYGWTRVKAVDGEVKISTDLKLTRDRTRILLKQGHRQSSIILVKE